jgi:hypothetical protein
MSIGAGGPRDGELYRFGGIVSSFLIILQLLMGIRLRSLVEALVYGFISAAFTGSLALWFTLCFFVSLNRRPQFGIASAGYDGGAIIITFIILLAGGMFSAPFVSMKIRSYLFERRTIQGNGAPVAPDSRNIN